MHRTVTPVYGIQSVKELSKLGKEERRDGGREEEMQESGKKGMAFTMPKS